MRILTRKKQWKIIEQILEVQKIITQTDHLTFEEHAKVTELIANSCREICNDWYADKDRKVMKELKKKWESMQTD